MPLSSKQTSDYLVEPAVVGAGLGAGAAYYWGANQKFFFRGSEYPLWPFITAAGALATAGMNLVNNYVNDHLPEQISIVTHPLETAIDIAGTTGMMLAVEQIVSPGLAGETLYPMVGLVAAAKLGGRYVAHEYLQPWLNSLKGY